MKAGPKRAPKLLPAARRLRGPGWSPGRLPRTGAGCPGRGRRRRGRRRRTTRILAATALAAVVCSLGAVLWTGGTSLHGRLWLPWKFLGSLPILDKVGPQRFTALADLLVATAALPGLDACWLATRRWRSSPEPGIGAGPPPGDDRRHRRGAGGGLGRRRGVGLGDLHAPLTTRRVSQPGWVRSVARAPVPGSATPVVLVYPFSMSATFNAGPLVVQAMSSMSFDLVGGYAKVPGPGGGALVLGRPAPPNTCWPPVVGARSAPGARPLADRRAPRRGGVTGTSLVVVTDAGRASYAAELFTAALGGPRAPPRAPGRGGSRQPRGARGRRRRGHRPWRSPLLGTVGPWSVRRRTTGRAWPPWTDASCPRERRLNPGPRRPQTPRWYGGGGVSATPRSGPTGVGPGPLGEVPMRSPSRSIGVGAMACALLAAIAVLTAAGGAGAAPADPGAGLGASAPVFSGPGGVPGPRWPGRRSPSRGRGPPWGLRTPSTP